MNKLILIDGLAILHRAYHALPPLTNKKGEPINAVYGFVSMLLRVIQDLKPTHLALAIDLSEPTFRHKAYKAYQGHRPQMDKDLSSQLDKAYEVARAFGISIYSQAGYEADDIIGTIAKQAVTHNIDEIVIVTGDKDILQLVTDKVKVYLPKKGLSEAKLMNINAVKEKMGVSPVLIPDYKALVGDPSDNYPGVSGIGPKTAVSLLSKYDGISDIYKNLKAIDEKTRKKLEEDKESALMSHKLATIISDVRLDVNFEKLNNWQVDSSRVLNLFSKLGFKTLTKRIQKVGKKINEERQMSLI